MSELWRQRIKFLAKLVVTASLCWWIFNSINLTVLRGRAENLAIAVAFLCVAILVIQSVIAAARLRLLCGVIGPGLRFARSWNYTLVGLFFNQVLPSTIGGDAIKVWLLTKSDGWSIRSSLHCILIDRAFGLIALFLVIALTMPWVISTIEDPQMITGIVAVLAMGILGTLIFAFLPKLPRLLERTRAVNELRALRDTFRSIFNSFPVYGLVGIYGVSMYLLNVGVVWFVAQEVGINADLIGCLVIVPIALLISFIPISIAGWGLREGAMVAGFAYVGVSATDAVFLSVTLGLCTTTVGLIGGILWLLTRPGKVARKLSEAGR